MAPAAGGAPLAIQPNAGLPSRIGERLIYLSSPAYMAEYAGRMVDAGARLVGGCCGTTPPPNRGARPRRGRGPRPAPAAAAHAAAAEARGAGVPRHRRARPAARPHR